MENQIWMILNLLHRKTWFIHITKDGDKYGGITFTAAGPNCQFNLSNSDKCKIDSYVQGYKIGSIKATGKNSFRIDMEK